MAITLALASALAYGIADFLGGVASRGWDSRQVTLLAQAIGLLIGVISVIVDPGDGISARALIWGGLSGIGTTVGVFSLYRGFSRGSISVVAPVSGVLTAVIPAVVGVALGDRLGALELVGILLTLPAVGLVARETPSAGGGSGGLSDGILAGLGFGFLFVGLAQAGPTHGAWPLLADQLVSMVFIVPVALRARSAPGAPAPGRRVLGAAVIAGVLSGSANLLYLLAAHHGELAIVGVLSSLYPAGTVIMARLLLSERWNRLQVAGMLAAVVAVVLVTLD